ncbi:MAG: histidinol-phosphatase HisJ family protein [Clostridia bacterium]|nr:histidinol-phosphatase HisJ family protein [Clostridia bacterium]
MFPRTSLHTHTVFCDGKETPDAMIRAAIAKGLVTIGFSSHAHMPHGGDSWAMSEHDTAAYRATVTALKSVYSGAIEVLLGIEQDAISDYPTDGYDYVIGATHIIEKAGDYLPVDHSRDRQTADVKKYYGGDYYKYVADYFAAESQVVSRTGCDIVAHFDLVTKFNEDNVLFDETDKRYLTPAVDALDEVLKNDVFFEINTGAAYRVGKVSQYYPADYLLKRIREKNGRIIFTADCHESGALCYHIGKAKEYAKRCGFRTAWAWTDAQMREFKI